MEHFEWRMRVEDVYGNSIMEVHSLHKHPENVGHYGVVERSDQQLAQPILEIHTVQEATIMIQNIGSSRVRKIHTGWM